MQPGGEERKKKKRKEQRARELLFLCWLHWAVISSRFIKTSLSGSSGCVGRRRQLMRSREEKRLRSRAQLREKSK